jgi:hypothetical protein
VSAIQWDRKDTDDVVKAVAIAGLNTVLAAAVGELQDWLYRRRKRERKRRKREKRRQR